MSNHRWIVMFTKLEAFEKEHGHCKVPHGGKGSLGMWVSTQRSLFKQDKLPLYKLELLDQLGFDWRQNSSWDQQYQNLVAYQEIHGHCNVSGDALGRWVSTQRQAHKDKRIQEDRKQLLDQLGFEWHRSRVNVKRWNEHYEDLQAFKTKHGHCNVRQLEGILGRWCSTQRIAFKHDRMPQHRIELLEKIGFQWAIQSSKNSANTNTSPAAVFDWEKQFEELKTYKQKHGHCNVTKADGALGVFVRKQRSAFVQERLPPNRKQLLDDIGFEFRGKWSQNVNRWNEMFESLKAYRKKHGHCNVLQTEGVLGRWVATQRAMFKKGQMPIHRVEQLSELDFRWRKHKDKEVLASTTCIKTSKGRHVKTVKQLIDEC